MIVLARVCRALKSGTPSTPSTTASPSMTKWLCLFLGAASTIQRQRSPQSLPFLGEQAHGVAVALNNQAIAVILNFREACGRRGTLVPGGGGGRAGMSFARAKIGLRVENVRIRSISYEMF